MASKSKTYYKTIAGVKYDKELLEQCEKAAADGQVSVKEAQDLWKSALDGVGVTKTEEKTLRYCLEMFKFTDKAAEFLKGKLTEKITEKQKATGATGYYKQINGVKYDRELLEQAEAFVKDGQISVAEAQELWELALDGSGVTATERRTLEYVLKEMKCTKPAADFLKKQLGDSTERAEPEPLGQSPLVASHKTTTTTAKDDVPMPDASSGSYFGFGAGMWAESDDAPEWMKLLTSGPTDADGSGEGSNTRGEQEGLHTQGDIDVPDEVANEGDAAALLLAVKDRLFDRGESAGYQTFLEAISQDPVDLDAASSVIASHPDLLISLERCFSSAAAQQEANQKPKSVESFAIQEEPLAEQRGSEARVGQLIQLLFSNISGGHEKEQDRVLMYARKRSGQPTFPRRLIIMRGPRGLGKSTWAENALVEQVSEAAEDLFASRLTHLCSADDFCMQFDGASLSDMRYVYDPSSVSGHHVMNQARVRLAMEAGIEPLYVDNTNMQLWDMRPYVMLADRMGYVVTVVSPHEISSNWGDIDFLVARNAQKQRQREKRITRPSLEAMIQNYEDIISVEDPRPAIRAAQPPVDDEDEAAEQRMLVPPIATMYKLEKLLKEGKNLMRYVPPDGKGWGVSGELLGEWPSFSEKGDGSCQYDEGGGGPIWYTGDPETSWSFADVAMLDDLKKQTAPFPQAAVPSATSHPALFATRRGVTTARPATTVKSQAPMSEPVRNKSYVKRKREEEEEEEDVEEPAMSRKERFKQRVLMKVKEEEQARSEKRTAKLEAATTHTGPVSAAPVMKPGVPTQQEETSAATFLAAVKSRLTEWGKLDQYHEFVVALSGSIDARAAVRILRGHDDLLQVFKAKFAPRADLVKIKSELEGEMANEQHAAQPATVKKRTSADDKPHAPAGPPPRRVKEELLGKMPVKSEIGKSRVGVKKETGAVKFEDAPHPPRYNPRAPRTTVTIGDDSDDELPDEMAIALAAKKGRDACIAELAKVIFYQERAAHQGARPRLEMVRYATKVASKPRFPRELFILRGPPGVGKSAYAMQQLVESIGSESNEERAMRLTHVLAMDDFFEKFGPDGVEYKFKASKIEACHIRNEARARLAMEAGIHPLYVDCPNMKLWEMQPYAELAERLGYVVSIVDPAEINERWDDLEYLVAATDTAPRKTSGRVVSRGALRPLLQAYEPIDSEDPVDAVRSAVRPAGESRVVDAVPMPPEPRPSVAAHKKNNKGLMQVKKEAFKGATRQR